LYSVGKMGKDVQLSVKLHRGGLGSGFLHNLEVGQIANAAIVRNAHFHFPKKAKTVIMVSNGTGIAPFLGMIDQYGRVQDIHLYCGFRNQQSFALYENAINKETSLLTQLNVAYSREGEKHYVRDLLLRDQSLICETLENNGVMMLCGSLSMQKDVIALLEDLCQQDQQKSISYYQSRGQILMDCY
ncbi:MAG: FAD-binding oxidoreductase, partial [Pedobacter sp.]